MHLSSEIFGNVIVVHAPEELAGESAEQFARDSGSDLGPIRRANQGLFVVLPRDQAPGVQEQRQRAKVVRVVTTIEYLLKD